MAATSPSHPEAVLDSGSVAARARTARRRWPLSRAGTYAVLVLLGAGSILPVLWMLSTSFKDTKAFYVFPPQFIPDNPTFENYTTFFDRGAWR